VAREWRMSGARVARIFPLSLITREACFKWLKKARFLSDKSVSISKSITFATLLTSCQ
jgi:hypothetical protein